MATELTAVHPSTALDADQQPTWNREQVELIKRTVADGTSDDELALFLQVAGARGLDPFAGEIYAVMRRDRQSPTGQKMTIQTGIDGYRKIADRTGLVDWVQGPEFTTDGDTWTDTWTSTDPPAAARFTVKRKDRSRPETRVARWVEYAQTDRDGNLTSMWRKLSATMIGKVAEAHALRAAFSAAMSGIYVSEEMHQADAAPTQPRPNLDDHVDRWPDEFLATVDLASAREFAAQSDDHLALTLKRLDDLHTSWQDGYTDDVTDAELVDDTEPAAEPAAGEPTLEDAEPEPDPDPAPEAETDPQAWRQIARDHGVTPSHVLAQLVRTWPSNNQSARPNRLSDVDELFVSTDDGPGLVGDAIRAAADAKEAA